MTQIRPNVYLGGWRDANDKEAMRKAGVTLVLNVAIDHCDSWVGVRGVKFGLVDGPGNPDWLVEMAVRSLAEMFRQGETVYVHCIEGVSRSPFVLAHALARLEGTSFERAYADIRSRRPGVMAESKLYGTVQLSPA